MTSGWQLARLGRVLRRRPLVPLAFAAAFLVVTALVASVFVLARTTASLEAMVADDVQIVAFMREEATEAQIARTAEEARRLPGVRAVTSVGADEALERLRRADERLRGAGEERGGIEDGFVPRSLEVTLDARTITSDGSATIASRLRVMSGVGDVDDVGDGLGRVRGFVAAARSFVHASTAAAVIVALGALLACVLLARRSRDDEATVLLLSGATVWQVQLPSRLAACTAALAGVVGGAGLVLATVHAIATYGQMGEVFPTALLAAARSIGVVPWLVAAAIAVVFAFVFGGERALGPEVAHA